VAGYAESCDAFHVTAPREDGSGAAKSMIGHLLGAAGAVEAIACLMAIRDGVIPPSINYETPDPECPINIVANEARKADVEIAMSNSLGFGGHNSSLILKRYE